MIKNRRDLVKLNESVYRHLMKNNKYLLDKHFPLSTKFSDKEKFFDYIKKYENYHDFVLDKKVYRQTQRNGYLKEVKEILPKYQPYTTRIHTIESIFYAVCLCSTVVEFRTKHPNEASAAQKMGLTYIISDILDLPDRRGKLDFKTLQEIASKFNNKTEFCRKDSGAYDKAKKMGIFEEITKHMADRLSKRVIRSDNVIFESAAEGSRSIGRAKSCVSKAILGGWKAGGYHWAYCDENGKVLDNKKKNVKLKKKL